MKKTLKIVAVLLVMVPAIIVACDCCPAFAQESEFVLERTPCHTCCSTVAEIQRDCGKIEEKSESVLYPHSIFSNIDLLKVSELNFSPRIFIASFSKIAAPPQIIPTLTTVLLI